MEAWLAALGQFGSRSSDQLCPGVQEGVEMWSHEISELCAEWDVPFLLEASAADAVSAPR